MSAIAKNQKRLTMIQSVGSETEVSPTCKTAPSTIPIIVHRRPSDPVASTSAEVPVNEENANSGCDGKRLKKQLSTSEDDEREESPERVWHNQLR